jgi:hypothetical protein
MEKISSSKASSCLGSSPFMEPEGSLPCLQDHDICPYPEEDISSLHPPTLFP